MKSNKKIMFKWIVSLSLVIFFFSNSIIIKRGMCSSSPCSDFNGSHRVAIPGYDDTFMESHSVPFLAPSAFILTKVLNKDVYEFYDKPINLRLDYKIDSEGEYYSDRILTDTNNFLGVTLFIKFIILLSLPIWIIISLMLYKIYSYNRKVGLVVLVMLFLIFGSLKIFISYDPFDRDGSIITFRHILLGI